LAAETNRRKRKVLVTRGKYNNNVRVHYVCLRLCIDAVKRAGYMSSFRTVNSASSCFVYVRKI